MDPKAAGTGKPNVNQREIEPDAESIQQAPFPRSPNAGDSKKKRPGESIMKSDDPTTAALREWAKDKQTQVPGSDGSFATGQMSMGVGAVSGGPMFLPRNEYIVEPPRHTTDHGAPELLHPEGGEEEKEKKKRGSFSRLFKKEKGTDEEQE